MDFKSQSGKILKFSAVFLVCLVFLVVLFFLQRPDGKLHLVFCDVGQGDAIFLTTPSGKQLLVDGGPNDQVLSCLSHHMLFWDRDLDLVALTHPQSDHLTGLISVLERFKVENLLTSGVENNTEQFKTWKNEIANPKIVKTIAQRGQKINLGDKVTAQVVWPAEGTGDDLNKSSVVLKISLDDFCAYLTGDVDQEVEDGLVSLGGLEKCLVLKVAHHGSKTALSDSFISAVSPKIAVISVGEKNSFGHPTKEVLEELERKDARIFRTDKEREVEIVTDGKSYKIKTGK